VEDTRELLENVQYAPSRGRYKVFLIDEVHMLSNHSFNALLKTLEEPPPHVKFLLATTDPQKLPVTVLSRCLQFNLKNLSPEKLVEHLKYILGQEQIVFEEPALWQLGRAAHGSVRDCLTLLDQAISFCEGKLTAAGVGEFLGSIDRTVILHLMQALIAQDATVALDVIRQVADSSPDFAVVLQELLSWLHRIAIAQAVPEAIDNSQGDREQVLAHAAALSAENVQLYYQIALKGREDLPLALDARSGLEMTLLRMLAFTPQLPGKTAAAVKPGVAADTGQKKKLTPELAVVTVAAAPPAAIKPPTIQPKPEPPVTQTGTPPTPAAVAPAAATVSMRPLALAEFSTDSWITVHAQLGLSGVTRSIAGHCALAGVDGSKVALVLDSQHGALFNEEHRKRLEQALTDYFGQPVALLVTLGKPPAETPSARRLRLEDERKLAAVHDFTHDPAVQALVQRFGAEINYDSISPLDNI